MVFFKVFQAFLGFGQKKKGLINESVGSHRQKKNVGEHKTGTPKGDLITKQNNRKSKIRARSGDGNVMIEN